MKILGIDTSCDDTSVAVVEDGKRILSNVISSQFDLHKKYGGIVRDFPVGIALHARRLSIPHPVRDERLELEAPLPDVWKKFLT